jgi:predicted kinase
MVRAKVVCMRAHQGGLEAAARARLGDEYRGYFALARRLAGSARPAIVLMHGLSGSGKTTAAQGLLESLGAVRVRSDVERKRLQGLGALERTREALDAGAYSPAATRRTYDRLAAVGRAAADAGFPVLVDAAFLRRADRDAFRALARELRVPFAIASCEAPEAILRDRVSARERAGADASEAGLAVLDRQIASQQPLAQEELAVTVRIDTARGEQAVREAARELDGRLQSAQAVA